jgi:hypothetical protein
MAAPTVEATRKAGAAVQTLSVPEINRRQSAEIGDPLMAFFAILARKLFPAEAESAIVGRVRMMMASWFLRGEIDHTPIAAPDEATARTAVDAVAGLDGRALDQRIEHEIGDVVMAYFSAFLNKVLPEKNPDARTKQVQLMIHAFLLRGDLAGKQK